MFCFVLLFGAFEVNLDGDGELSRAATVILRAAMNLDNGLLLSAAMNQGRQCS